MFRDQFDLTLLEMNSTVASGLNAPIHKSDGKMSGNAKGVGRRRRGRVRSGANSGVRALQLVRQLARYINTEIHYSDISLGSTAVSSTMAFNLLNGSSTGDAVTNRTGSSIKLNGCDIRFGLTGNVTAVSMNIRVLVVIDNACDGLAFAATDLLTSSSVYATYSAFNQMRFRVLYDSVFALATAGPFQAFVVKALPANVHVMYNIGNAGTIADINTNSLYLCYVSDQAVNTGLIQGYFRTWFIDN